MPARVKVRAVIWIDDQVVVHKVQRHGRTHITLPGGRVNERESIADALTREVIEEIGQAIEVGDMLFAAEVFRGARHQDVELIFAATFSDAVDASRLDLVDPADRTIDVMPPVLDELPRYRDLASEPARWLGNLYLPRQTAYPADRDG